MLLYIYIEFQDEKKEAARADRQSTFVSQLATGLGQSIRVDVFPPTHSISAKTVDLKNYMVGGGMADIYFGSYGPSDVAVKIPKKSSIEVSRCKNR